MRPGKKKKSEFINREISWLSFNERILQEASDESVPLIERIRFLGIFSNNLDEFFKVRVATLRRARLLKSKAIDPMDFDPSETLLRIHLTVLRLQEKFDKTFERLIGELKKEGIDLIHETQLSSAQKLFVDVYFEEKVRPFLSPLMLSWKAAFPPLNDNTIYLAIELGYKSKKSSPAYALVEIPARLPRFVKIPGAEGRHCVMFLDDVVRFRVRRLFDIFDFDQARGFAIKITRDAELDIDDDLSKSLVDKMAKSLSQRKKGDYVRLIYDRTMPQPLLEFVLRKIKIKDTENSIAGVRYHKKRDLMSFPDFGRKDLCYPPQPPLRHPRLTGKNSILDEIKKGDILLHFPYHSFVHLVDLLRQAAIDPDVKTIRISIYRLAPDSQVLNALINAARNGKRVVAVVEVQARFDEARNILAAQALTESGVRVIPGVPGLKVHSKLIQISRREKGKTVRYVHIGTGNFHEQTAQVYSDLSLLTAHPEIGQEVRKIFEFFESNFTRHVFRHLIVSPFSTRRRFVDLINTEISNARKGLPASITIKMNNLVDATMIRKLYEASEAGVKVNLILRGICSLIPGVPEMSQNIEAVSIIGRYLEHARVILFENNGSPVCYLSSADWMTRNLDHRIEVSTPVLDQSLIAEIRHLLEIQLSPQTRARVLTEKLDNPLKPGFHDLHSRDAQADTYTYYLSQSNPKKPGNHPL